MGSRVNKDESRVPAKRRVPCSYEDVLVGYSCVLYFLA